VLLTGLLNKEVAENAGIDETTDPIVPEEACNSSWEKNSHDEGDPDIVAVLPDDNWILIEIRNVGSSNAFGVFCKQSKHGTL
jgi:hypothetical protein